ncbi:hypothetical protein Tco_1569669 [Tanacetum coccineum]
MRVKVQKDHLNPNLHPSPPYTSEAQVEPQPDPSPRPSPTLPIPDPILKGSGGNQGGQSSSDKSISGSEGGLTLRSVYDLYLSLCKQVTDQAAENKDLKAHVRSSEGTAKQQSTDKPAKSTDKPNEGTDSEKVSTDQQKLSTDKDEEDDETIAQNLLNMSQAKAVSREKEKGVELKDVENVERPRLASTRYVLNLKPLPKINPKDKGKKRIEDDDESGSESDEEGKKILADEEAIKAAFIQEFDDIQARIEADRLLALRLQEEEKQRAAAIKNRPPTRTQLMSQMRTYLKHVRNKKHSDLKNKTFEEIQALYEKVKSFDESFIVIGFTEDERKIKEMNEGASDPDKKKKFVKDDVLTKVPAKPDVAEQGTKKRKGGHMKMLARKRKRPQPNVDSDDEHRKCLKIVTFEGTIDSEIMERKSVIARQDLFHLYDLVMKQYSEVTLEGIELILWGDLKIMIESSTEENDQSDF